MQALDLLLNRSSQPKLQSPAPQGQELETIMQAALKVPDHASLTPWRFIVCQGQGLHKLGELFYQAALTEGMSERDISRAKDLPLRAPMVMVAISEYCEHEKVPRVEQIASTSCAVYAMQLAAQALGFDSMWRTGAYAHSKSVKQLLGLKTDDEIIGFIYLGSTSTKVADKPKKQTENYFEFWN